MNWRFTVEGKIAEAITYYQDEHTLIGKCDLSWPIRRLTWIW
jgi:hypothetical protein